MSEAFGNNLIYLLNGHRIKLPPNVFLMLEDQNTFQTLLEKLLNTVETAECSSLRGYLHHSFFLQGLEAIAEKGEEKL